MARKISKTILTPQQVLTVERIAAGVSQVDIARDLNIRQATISVWKQDPDFRAAVDAALNDVVSATRDRTKGMADKMLSVLCELALGDEVPHAVRRQAASDLLDRCGVTAARAIEVSGRDGAAIRVDVRNLADLPIAELERLAADGATGSE